MNPSAAHQHTTQIALHLAHADDRRILIATTEHRLWSCQVHAFGNGMVTVVGQEIVDVESLQAQIDMRRQVRHTLRIEEIASVQPVPPVKPSGGAAPEVQP